MRKPEGSVYEFSAPLLDGSLTALGEFRGSVLLIVNTASQCGFTPQYTGLEQLYRTYKEQGFAVLGFPCNQFGGQEPGSAAEIGAFCQRNYGASFPIFAKVDVNGPDAHPLYGFLKRSQRGLLGMIGMSRIAWNFTKFLVDRKGMPVERFRPSIAPQKLVPRVEALLADPD